MIQAKTWGVRAGALCVLLALCQGCAGMGVEPWERDLLAKPEMTMSAETVELSFDEHVYFSKEASSGGRGFAGGGCGCN